jgi:hypothetical protein
LIVVLAGLVAGRAGIAAKGVGQDGVQGQHAVQPVRRRMRTTSWLEHTSWIEPSPWASRRRWAPIGTPRPTESMKLTWRRSTHELSVARVDRLVQAVTQRWRAGEVDFASSFHDGVAASGDV